MDGTLFSVVKNIPDVQMHGKARPFSPGGQKPTITPANVWFCLQWEWLQSEFTSGSSDSAVDMFLSAPPMETKNAGENANLARLWRERGSQSNMMHQREKQEEKLLYWQRVDLTVF